VHHYNYYAATGDMVMYMYKTMQFLFAINTYISSTQFYDLQELFRTGGQIPETAYVFMV
jgi:hypothetical protein